VAVVIPPGAWPSDPVREAGEWQHLKEIFRAARRQPAKSYARIQFQRLAGGSALLMWDDNGVRMVVADRDLPASRQRAALKAVRRARPALAALPVGLLLIDWLRRALGGHQLVTVGGAGLVAATTSTPRR
jgi:hypothetical protein